MSKTKTKYRVVLFLDDKTYHQYEQLAEIAGDRMETFLTQLLKESVPSIKGWLGTKPDDRIEEMRGLVQQGRKSNG